MKYNAFKDIDIQINRKCITTNMKLFIIELKL